MLKHINGLSDDTIAILVRLFRKVRTENEKRYLHGMYLNPVVAHVEPREPSEPSRRQYATFVNYPYFRTIADLCIKDPDEKPRDHDQNDHPPRTLLQSHYKIISTEARDSKQVYKRLAELTSDDGNGIATRNLFVPQLWAIHINEGLDSLFHKTSKRDIRKY